MDLYTDIINAKRSGIYYIIKCAPNKEVWLIKSNSILSLTGYRTHNYTKSQFLADALPIELSRLANQIFHESIFLRYSYFFYKALSAFFGKVIETDLKMFCLFYII